MKPTGDGPKSDDVDREYAEFEERIAAALDAESFNEATFRTLALEVHRFQRRRNAPYDRYCQQIGAPEAPADWREIPAVPQSVFKLADLRCFAESKTVRTFLTSGTTCTGRGRHHFCSLKLYHRAVQRGWEIFALPQLRRLVLTPEPEQAPESSLSEMMQVLPGPGAAEFFVAEGNELDAVRMEHRLRQAIEAAEPILIPGTALAFVRFIEHCSSQGIHLPLPAGSALMETGGYKGSKREIAKADLYARLGEQLGISPAEMINEYGMTELSSQCYTRGLGKAHEAPPWMRVLVIDPETGREVPTGETGVLRLFDLANLGSVLAIETQDLAIRGESGFHLIGRDPGALPRGCSRAF